MSERPAIRIDPERLQSEPSPFPAGSEETDDENVDETPDADDKTFGETDIGSVPPAR